MAPTKEKEITVGQDALLAVIKGNKAAHKIVDGGTHGIPEETADTEMVNEVKYVLKQLRLINEQCEKNKVDNSNWENLDLAGRIAAIAKSRVSTTGSNTTLKGAEGDVSELVQTALALVDRNSMARQQPPPVQMKKVVEDLEHIKKDLNNASLGVIPGWRDQSLAKKVTWVVGHLKPDSNSAQSPDPAMLEQLSREINRRFLAKLDTINDKAFKDRLVAFFKGVVEEDKKPVGDILDRPIFDPDA